MDKGIITFKFGDIKIEKHKLYIIIFNFLRRYG